MDVSRNMQFSFVLIALIAVSCIQFDFVICVDVMPPQVKRALYTEWYIWSMISMCNIISVCQDLCNMCIRMRAFINQWLLMCRSFYIFILQCATAQTFDRNLTALQQNYDLQVLNPKSATYTADADIDFALFTKWSNWSKCSRKCLTRRFR